MTTNELVNAHSYDGEWDVAMHGPHHKTRNTLTLRTGDGGLVAVLEPPFGESEVTADGSKLSWTVAVDGAPAPVRFEVAVIGDEMYGTAVSEAGGIGATSFVDAVRVGSGAQVRSRLGSDAIAETLNRSGVEYVFGFAGGESGALERAVMDPEHGMRTLACRNELNAAWVSYGYNRVKRRAASAVSVWCVGAMHASPVVYAAKQDSTPLVFFATEQSTAWDARDILQDTSELFSALKPVAKYAKRLVNVEDVTTAVRRAVLTASTGRFGPSVLCLTHDTTNGRTAMEIEDLRLPAPPAAAEQEVTTTLEMIAQAERPVILAGAGVHLSDAAGELRAFAEASGIPVVTSGPGGRGVLPDDHPLYAGDSTLWGGFPTGISVAQEADLWLAIGFSFSQTATHSWTLVKPEKVVHVDVVQDQIGQIFQPTVGITADARAFLGQLRAGWQETGYEKRADARVDEIKKAKDDYVAKLAARRGVSPIRPIALGQVLADELPADTLLVNDEGFMVPGMTFSEAKYPNGFAPPLGFHYASLGSTLPVAIGAKLAAPERTVISFGGDGGFFYDCGELATLAQYGIGVIVIVNNNSGLYGGNRGSSLGPVVSPFHGYSDSDFAAVARGFGVPAERVEAYEEFAPALRRALASGGPYFIDVVSGGSVLEVFGLHDGPFPPKGGHADASAEGSWPS